MGLQQSSGDAKMTEEEMHNAFDIVKGRRMGREGLAKWSPDALSGFSLFTSDSDRQEKAEVQRRLKKKHFECPSEDRAIGCFMGMAIGDALGSPLEFSDVRYGSTELRGFDQIGVWRKAGYNRFGLQPGQWTDDTAMGLCLADSLIAHDHRLVPMDLRLRFQNWWTFGYNNAFGHDGGREERGSVGLGGNISMALQEFREEDDVGDRTKKGDPNTSGNGSVMRNAAVSVCFWRDAERAMQAAEGQSYTTHMGTEAAECCRLLTKVCVDAIRSDIGGTDEHGRTAVAVLDRALEGFESRLYAVRCLAQSKAEEKHEENRKLKLADRNWNWKDPNYRFCASRAADQPGYVGSYAMDAVAMALHCVHSTTSFEEALVKSVNLRGDSDSVSAVTGQIAGAVYGAAAIPSDWIAAVQQWDNGGEIALRAFKLFQSVPAPA